MHEIPRYKVICVWLCSCVSTDQCRTRGAVILFTVMDHDFLMTNDFAGEVYLSLNTIPGISGEEVSGFSPLSPCHSPSPRRAKAVSTWLLYIIHM